MYDAHTIGGFNDRIDDGLMTFVMVIRLAVLLASMLAYYELLWHHSALGNRVGGHDRIELQLYIYIGIVNIPPMKRD